MLGLSSTCLHQMTLMWGTRGIVKTRLEALPAELQASRGHTARFSGMLPSAEMLSCLPSDRFQCSAGAASFRPEVVSFEELESNWTQDEASAST